MMIKLYHGSNVRVEKPDLKKSKPYKDFGQGFYLSDDFRNFRPPSKFGNRFLLPISGICCFLFAEWSGKGGILLEMSNIYFWFMYLSTWKHWTNCLGQQKKTDIQESVENKRHKRPFKRRAYENMITLKNILNKWIIITSNQDYSG